MEGPVARRRGGEGDGVGAEPGLDAAGRNDGRRGVGRGNSDEPFGGGHGGIGSGGAEMARVAHGDHGHAGCAALVDGEFHGQIGGDMAEPAAAVDQRRGFGFRDDADFGRHGQEPGGEVVGVFAQHGDAVGIDAMEVGVEQVVERGFDRVIGHPPGGQDGTGLAREQVPGDPPVRPPAEGRDAEAVEHKRCGPEGAGNGGVPAQQSSGAGQA